MNLPSPSKRKVYSFNDEILSSPGNVILYDRERFGDSCFLIDNGSSLFRAGWSHDPLYRISFPPFVARTRGSVAVGKQIQTTKDKVKTPFHKDVVYSFKPMEDILDYTFKRFSFGEEGVPHPVVMTELPFAPSFSRSITNELLFEYYETPSVLYGIDAMFSYYYYYTQNHKGRTKSENMDLKSLPTTTSGIDVPKNALVIRSGSHRTHVLPFIDGKLAYDHSRSIPIGGELFSEYFLHLVSLKYPQHANSGLFSPSKVFPLSKMKEIKESSCYVSKDYHSEIRKFSSDESYFHKKTLFFDISPPVIENNETALFPKIPEKVQLTEEQLEQKKIKRQNVIAKMREQGRKNYEERIRKEEEDFKYFGRLQSMKPEERKVELGRIGFSEIEFLESFNILKKKIGNRKKREARKKKLGSKEIENSKIIVGEEGESLIIPRISNNNDNSNESVNSIIHSNLVQPPPIILNTTNASILIPPVDEGLLIETEKKKSLKRSREEFESDEINKSKILENEISNEPRLKKEKLENDILQNEVLKTTDPEKWLEETRKKRDELLNNIKSLEHKIFGDSSSNPNVSEISKSSVNRFGRRRTKRKAATRGRLKQITQALLSTSKIDEKEKLKKPRKRGRKKKKNEGKIGAVKPKELYTRRKKKRKKKNVEKQFYESDSNEEEDLFGLHEDDWNIYREMNDKMETQKSKVLEQRKELEIKKQKFGEYEISIANMEMKLYNKSLNQVHQNHYMRQYQHLKVFSQGNDNVQLMTLNAQLRESERHQVHLTVERMRVPEILFSPSFVGKKCCGLKETLELVIRSFKNNKDIEKLCSNIYLCGGNMMIKGMKERIYGDLRSLLPASLASQIHIVADTDTVSSRESCWRGMKQLVSDSGNDEFSKYSLSKKEYQENGSYHFTKENWFGNCYLKFPEIVEESPPLMESTINQRDQICSQEIVKMEDEEEYDEKGTKY